MGSSWSVKIFIRPSLKLTSGNSNSLPFFSVFGTGWRVDRTQIQCSGCGVFDMSVDVTFSNLLIIHQAKLRQRKSQAWRRFEYPVLISIEFDDFTSPFIPYFLFRLRKYIKHSRQCFIGYPNTSNFVKNTPLRVAFSTLFSVFGYPHETLSRVWVLITFRIVSCMSKISLEICPDFSSFNLGLMQIFWRGLLFNIRLASTALIRESSL